MDRIYMNRLPGQERIHIEIDSAEVADLLDDLPAWADGWFDATKGLRRILQQASVDLGQTHRVLGTVTTPPEGGAPPVDRAAVLCEAATALDQRAAVLEALSSSSFGEESSAARELTEQADRLRRLADEAQQPAPAVTEEAGPVARCDVMFEDGRQCAKPDGHRPPGSDDPHVPTP